MAPKNDDGSSSLMSEQYDIQSKLDTDDLLGLEAPAAPAQDYDPFSSTTSFEKDDDILSLASELTKGAVEFEAAKSAAKSMELNDAFLSLDKMRQANIEIEFGQKIDHKKCVQCIRALPVNKRPSTPSPYRLLKNPMKKRKPCLLCGNPTCHSHIEKSFAKSKVVVCIECAPLFSLDFIIECISHSNNMDDPDAAAKQRHQIKHMIDVYDRVLIMLEYASQYIDEISVQLEKSTKKVDKIGLGCNTSGVMSGVAGVAAAACFVTPAGPPLLIASLLFSGASQMTSSGSKMVNYYSTPNKIAFKIISLYNLCKSVLTVTTVLRDALLNDHINLEKYVENMIKETEEAAIEMKTGFETEEDDIDVTEDADTDFNDDESWSSFTSATSATPSQAGSVSARYDKPETPLTKIDESKELKEIDEAQAAPVVPHGFNDLFISNDGGIPSPPKKSAAADEYSNANNSTAIVTAVPTTVGIPSSGTSPSNSPLKDAQNPSEDKNSPSKSPSKQEQIEELKKTNHFMEREDKVGSLARFYSRSSLAGSSLVSAAAVTMMAGAALSAVHFAFEANNLAATIKRIQAGSPSKRAQALRLIKEDIKNLPGTNVIVGEWDKYLAVLAERRTSTLD